MRAKLIQGYYHVCSDGNRVDVLFRNETDFIAAMNRIAVCSLRFKIVILAFVLMHNHFHFVIQADSEEEAIRFINEFKRLTGKHDADLYRIPRSLAHLPVKIIPVTDEDYLKTLIGYVIKNPTKARIAMFYNYPWGTGGLYFREEHQKIRHDGSQSVRTIKKECRTHCHLPKDWIVTGGVILPENYVDIRFVEHLFTSSRAFMFFLSLNKDDEMEQTLGEWNEINLNDSELRAERERLAQEMFGARTLRDLSATDRLKLALQMRRQFLCSKKQIARIVHLPYEVIQQRL